jgi:hypothetical protein
MNNFIMLSRSDAEGRESESGSATAASFRKRAVAAGTALKPSAAGSRLLPGDHEPVRFAIKGDGASVEVQGAAFCQLLDGPCSDVASEVLNVD